MHAKKLFLSFFLLPLSLYSKQDIAFNKVVIWGWKMHSHTHSYIHYAFYKTFKHLGYDTYWFDNKDDLKDFDFDNALFITEGQVDQDIPLRDTSYYILHNCPDPKYNDLFDNKHVLLLKVYVHDVFTNGHQDLQKLDDYTYCSMADNAVYMPWATDLLPHEIDDVKERVKKSWGTKKENMTYWIGSTGQGYQGPAPQLAPFIKACKANGIAFRVAKKQHWPGAMDPEENLNLIFKSYLAPAIQCQWQLDHGYIPCRIFKNISYGQLGITNSKTVYELFDKKIVYNENTEQLFYDAQERIKHLTLQELLDLMDFVKNKHTYINRISTLLEVFSLL